MGRPYAEVIGDPIAQSKSPLIHNFWLGKLGLDAEYRACHVTRESLADYLCDRNADDNWRGCNVTMPHKLAVMPLLDRLSPEAERIGAVNTVVMRDYYLEGHNTDGAGFMEPLQSLLAEHPYSGPTLPGRTAALIGAGGAARAIADALDQAHFTIISYSRDPEKADRAIGRYIWDKDLICSLADLARETAGARARAPIPVDPHRIDLFVNASPLGMAGQPPLNVEAPRLIENEIVYDIVTVPLDTPLLQAARASGLRTIDGLAMLIGQAAVAFEKFFGQAAPRQHDAELRALLTA
jgi:shikimate dehydrogenase